MALHEKVKVLGDIAARRSIKQFAGAHHLVYFGHVDQHDEDYELVRGATMSTTHIDRHYTVGTIENLDVILVERSNKLRHVGRKPVLHKWLILQLDLKRGGHPHVFVDSHQHDETFHAWLFAQLSRFQDLSHMFRQSDPEFARQCKVFGLPQQFAEIEDILKPDIVAPLVHQFKHLDYEIQDDRLYIYASKTRPTIAIMQEMVRVGLWLADKLDELTTS